MKNELRGRTSKKIWIDLENSPHVPFFVPIIAELERRGYSAVVTGRDCFQVGDLARLFDLKCKLIGRHYGKHKLIKLFGLCYRSLQLDVALWKEKPSLALSHGSRSQLIACTTLGIPTLMLFDYEFASGLGLVKPNWIMVPEVIPIEQLNFCADRVLQYPGIKEDVYISQFEPDPGIRSQLHVNGEHLLVTVRPPANEAHYHNPESDVLYHAVMEYLAEKPDVRVALLPRNDKQAKLARHTWRKFFESGSVMIPDHVVDGRNLIWHSDLVISGGGTMNREAAALGAPVYSFFRGKIGAVDRYLAEKNRLVLLKSVEDVRNKIQLRRHRRAAGPEHGNKAALNTIVNTVISIMEAKCPTPRSNGH
jgi:predicted glycosyltransferase